MLLVPIDPTKKQRGTKWICVCPHCQNERTVSYSQKWNIATKKCSDICDSCSRELGTRYIDTGPMRAKLTAESQKKGAEARKGIKRPNTTKFLEYLWLFGSDLINNKEVNNKRRLAKLGKYGDKANNWRGGTQSERRSAMAREPYKNLRKSVFARDNYTCQICLVRGGNLEMDHIKEWCNYPELQYEEKNCRTLCKNCHKSTDNFANKALKKRVKNAL